MTTIAYKKEAVTGGTATSLDGINGNLLSTGDFAFVMIGNAMHAYQLDATSGATEALPYIVSPDTNAGTKRWILQGTSAVSNYYTPDYSETDQGVAGSGRTINTFVEAIGATKQATIFLAHNSGGDTTTYTLTTSETIPSNIALKIEAGAIIDGAGTLTINSYFDKPHEQCFGSSITVAFGGGAVSEAAPEWWDVDGTADDVQIQAAIDSLGNGGIIKLLPKEYSTTSTIVFPENYSHELRGSGGYETGSGTRIKWSGGNSDSVIQVDDNVTLKDMFIYKSAAQTSIIGIDANGASGVRTPTHLDLINVQVKSLAYGFYFNYSWYNSLRNCFALYCTTGFYFGTEANNNDLYSCHSSYCTTGVEFGGTGSRQILFSGCSFEDSTTGIDCSGGEPTSLQILNCYFEGNTQSIDVAGYGIVVDNCFYNHDTNIFDIGSTGLLEIKNIWFSNDTTLGNVYKFTSGDFGSDYVEGSISIGASYPSYALSTAIINYPEIVTGGYLDMNNSSVSMKTTERIDASATHSHYIYPYELEVGIAKQELCLVVIVAETLIDVGAGGIQFRFGTGGAGYDQLLNVTTADGVDIAIGTYLTDDAIFTTVTTALQTSILAPATYNYKCNNTAAAVSGTYRMVFISAS